MAARVLAPGLGAVTACCGEGGELSPYLQPGEGYATLAFRYLHSFRDFHGDEDIPVPSNKFLYADTHVYGFLLALTYQVTDRFSISVDEPFQYGTRDTFYEHTADFVTYHGIHRMEARGPGDLRIIGSMWLLDPKTHYHGNVSVGLGVKLPTGNYRATDLSYRSDPPVYRPVDPAIQPGNGGTGIATGVQAFQRISNNLYAYLEGTYLMEPRDSNGTQFPAGDLTIPGAGARINHPFAYESVPDSYFGRGGIGIVLWPEYGLALTLGGRIDGVPPDDVLGSNKKGTRITGYSVYFEPGITITKGRYTFSVTGPVAVRRYAGTDPAADRILKKFPDAQLGFAALADYLVTTSISVRF